MTAAVKTPPKRLRSRAAKAKAPEPLTLTINPIKLGAEAALALIEPSLTAEDLKAKIAEVSGIRERTVAEIERLSREHTAMVSNLTGVDGALQVLGQLVEAVEAKTAA